MPYNKPNGHLHQALFNNIIDGLAFCQIISDKNGKPMDWEYISVNPAFERQSGLKDVTGKRVSELVPGIHDTNPHLLETYARVARTQTHERFEQYIPQLGMWFDISVYSFEPETFVAVFENITPLKKLVSELEKANAEIRQAYDDTLKSWAKALEIRDRETSGHTLRVVDMAEKLARQLSFTEAEILDIRRGALLHDIGKMAVSEAILHKVGKLDAEERELMNQHPQIAYDILFPIQFLGSCAKDIPYCHHELWNGTGYPRGLNGFEIPACARMFTVVDVFDAMTSDRPYRKALSRKFTLKYMDDNAGKLYDPIVVEVFLRTMQDDCNKKD